MPSIGVKGRVTLCEKGEGHESDEFGFSFDLVDESLLHPRRMVVYASYAGKRVSERKFEVINVEPR